MCSGWVPSAWPAHAICHAVRTGSPRSGPIRLGRCRTSGQLVSTASSTAASATQTTSARTIGPSVNRPRPGSEVSGPAVGAGRGGS